MKKFIVLFIFIINLLSIFFYTQLSNIYKIFKVVSPIEIYVDLNKNLVFDEKEPCKIKNIHYIGEELNPDLFPVINEINEEEKFFLKYMSFYYANNILNNKYVRIYNKELYIGDKKYSDVMLQSKLVFDDTVQSQQEFLKNIKSINLDDYVIYNIKSKKYHKIGCKEGQKSANFKIIKLSEIQENGRPCNICIKKEVNYSAPPHPYSTNIKISDSFKTDNINIYFIDLNKIFKPSSNCKSTACIALKNEINNAKTSIDFAIYGINNQKEIFNALVNAQKRGVKIRWVFDFDKKNINYYPDSLKLTEYIQDYKTDELYEANNHKAIMHNKFFIFDEKKVWTGSANITSTDLTDFNANLAVLINSKSLAQKYTEEFNRMYNGSFHKEKSSESPQYINLDNNTKIKPLFSPQHNIIKKEIIPLIDNAKDYIYIPIFFITHKEFAQALINAHKRGVEIKVINDATNAHSKYTVHKLLREEGIKVKTENYAGKMHMKAIIIDDNISILGSMNLTKSANNKNDENVLIIKNKEIAKYLKSVFQYLWEKIPDKYESYDPRAESNESIGSCFDGIDNDFDGKIDSLDEGCFCRN